MPNSSLTKVSGRAQTPEGEDCIKINVTAIPEKGKANKALLMFLAKLLSVAKTNFEIISGETDRYKKIEISTNADLDEKLEKLWENVK